MDNAQIPAPAATRLARVVKEGFALSSKPSLSLTVANIWVIKARAALSQIYGKDSREVDAWCPGPPIDRDRTPQDKLLQRLPKLERFLRQLQPPGLDQIFIGHGRSAEWLKLQAFLTRNLALQCDEFNTEPAAGIQTSSRIESMLSSATMAFLVMTAENEHADGSRHARQNVVHEIGLFQARLGPRQAIIMLEHGCHRFSNIDGLTSIEFPAGDIMARSEDVRRVLAREGLI